MQDDPTESLAFKLRRLLIWEGAEVAASTSGEHYAGEIASEEAGASASGDGRARAKRSSAGVMYVPAAMQAAIALLSRAARVRRLAVAMASQGMAGSLVWRSANAATAQARPRIGLRRQSCGRCSANPRRGGVHGRILLVGCAAMAATGSW